MKNHGNIPVRQTLLAMAALAGIAVSVWAQTNRPEGLFPLQPSETPNLATNEPVPPGANPALWSTNEPVPPGANPGLWGSNQVPPGANPTLWPTNRFSTNRPIEGTNRPIISTNLPMTPTNPPPLGTTNKSAWPKK